MKTYIVGAKRTAIGAYLGNLKDIPASELGTTVVSYLLKETGIKGEMVDELICGNVLSANSGQGIARQIAIGSGIPNEKCAYSLNMICGSGLKAINLAHQSVRSCDSDIVIAGGVENMSDAPMLIPAKVRTGTKMGNFEVVDYMIQDALTDAFSGVHMGITAENIAEKYNINRQSQDEFAFESQRKAIAASDSGKFVDEIVPVSVKVRRETVEFSTDEYINKSTSLEKLAKLRTVFKKDGTVTAANASGINDGAAFVAIANERAIEKYNLKPMAEIVSIGQAGVDPQFMGLGPVPAISKALKSADLKLSDIDLLELNEAFAAQSLGVIHELLSEYDIDRESLIQKTNVNGGAIALGHPVGASGSRILVTLLHEMKKRNSTYGLASLCIGGGMGVATVVKSID